VSEDQRVSRNPGEPAKTGPAGADRWAGYLDWVREDLVEGVLSLPPDEQRRARVPSGWSPLELLSHVLHMEQRWFVWGFLGETVAEPWGDWNVPDPSRAEGGPEARWTVAEHVTAEDLASRLRTLGGRTRAVLQEFPLDAPARTGGRFAENPPTLEWICFHVLAEYARHAGHLDIVAEIARA
jgi:uncharacterized damage-inducible protein DinB